MKFLGIPLWRSVNIRGIFPSLSGFSDLVDLWVIKIKKSMILCARSTSKSREQSKKRRSRSENMRKVRLFYSQNDCMIIKHRIWEIHEVRIGLWALKKNLIVLFGCWLAGRENSDQHGGDVRWDPGYLLDSCPWWRASDIRGTCSTAVLGDVRLTSGAFACQLYLVVSDIWVSRACVENAMRTRVYCYVTRFGKHGHWPGFSPTAAPTFPSRAFVSPQGLSNLYWKRKLLLP